MSLRPATVDDLDSLLTLESEGFDHARWSRDSWAAELHGPDRHVIVDDADGVRAVATFSILDDTSELLRVLVAPALRGRGIARVLLDDGFVWARAQGAARMLLEVEESNAPARALYARTGFGEIARRQNYYGAGNHALVMEKEL